MAAKLQWVCSFDPRIKSILKRQKSPLFSSFWRACLPPKEEKDSYAQGESLAEREAIPRSLCVAADCVLLIIPNCYKRRALVRAHRHTEQVLHRWHSLILCLVLAGKAAAFGHPGTSHQTWLLQIPASDFPGYLGRCLFPPSLLSCKPPDRPLINRIAVSALCILAGINCSLAAGISCPAE